MDRDRKLIKKSYVRLVTFGDRAEQFTYQKPYFYNFPPDRVERTTGQRDKNKERRSDNLYTARRKIQRLIHANANQNNRRYGLRFYTYTFEKNVTNLKEANLLWTEFSRKLRIRFRGIKYLGVVEFQKRGAVHYHVLYFNLPFKRGIKREIEQLWGNGFIYAKSIKAMGEIRNVGLYVSKYLQKEIMDIRLSGEKAYFTSKGLVKPQEYRDFIHISHILNGMESVIELKEKYVSHTYGEINKTTSKIYVSNNE